MPPVLGLDTLYKIANVQYPNQAVDLIESNPNGPVSGYHKQYDYNNQNWYLINVGDNQFNIKNGYTGTYAFAYSELEGVPLSANASAYKWVLVDVEPGVYQIATADLAYVWVLEYGTDYYSILLRDAANHKGPTAQWTITEFSN